MKVTRLISLFLCLNILFSNMAWAMDECSLNVEFSTHTVIQFDSAISSNGDIASPEKFFTDDTSVDNTCNIFCVGWTHLNYISYTTPVINITKTHSDVVQCPFTYHFSQHKPPTEPPKV